MGAFDGGVISSDAGALLLGATDKAIRLVRRFADCFSDGREAASIEHTVATLVGQRLFAMALVSSRGEDYSVAPLTDPDRRLSRIRLFPRMSRQTTCYDSARTSDGRCWKRKAPEDSAEPVPGHAALAASGKNPAPVLAHLVNEGRE